MFLTFGKCHVARIASHIVLNIGQKKLKSTTEKTTTTEKHSFSAMQLQTNNTLYAGACADKRM